MTLSGKGWLASAGETFDSIALAVYGSERYAADILCANPELCRVPVFSGGERVYLPLVEIQQASSAPYAPSRAPWKE